MAGRNPEPPGCVVTRARLLDTEAMEYREPVDLLVEGGRIREVSDRPIAPGARRLVEAGGRVVMPGLIDAHVHAIGSEDDLRRLPTLSPFLLAARARGILHGMLLRGFTTVRDAGGADAGLRAAVEQDLFPGPRLFVCDLGLAQTGGQGDFRAPGEPHLGCPCCGGRRSITRVVDGPEEIRLAVRRMLRDGADQIKVMASGGLSSGVPIDRLQFSPDELALVVAEARRGGTYVMAHAYQDEAILHCLAAGVRSIEHASHMADPTIEAVLAAGAFVVPTLSVYETQITEGTLPPQRRAAFQEVLTASLETIGRAHARGVPLGYGTDLEGSMHPFQSREFRLRAQVLPNAAVIAGATTVNAALLGRSGELGTLRPGAMADLLVLDGDPLRDIDCLARPDAHLRVVMKGGRIHHDTL